MAGRNVLFACCVLILSGIQFSYGQFNPCGSYEVESDCKDTCNTCEPKYCILSCTPGCSCIPGFKRDNYGICIPEEFCNRDTSVQGRGLLGGSSFDDSRLDGSGLGGSILGVSGCPIPRLCVRSCNRRGFRDGICLGPRREYCNCFSASTRPL